jgi:hypothetical protein
VVCDVDQFAPPVIRVVFDQRVHHCIRLVAEVIVRRELGFGLFERVMPDTPVLFAVLTAVGVDVPERQDEFSNAGDEGRVGLLLREGRELFPLRETGPYSKASLRYSQRRFRRIAAKLLGPLCDGNCPGFGGLGFPEFYREHSVTDVGRDLFVIDRNGHRN